MSINHDNFDFLEDLKIVCRANLIENVDKTLKLTTL